jgi:hypothetical protein
LTTITSTPPPPYVGCAPPAVPGKRCGVRISRDEHAAGGIDANAPEDVEAVAADIGRLQQRLEVRAEPRDEASKILPP